MRKVLLTPAILLAGLWAAGCPEDSSDAIQIPVAPADVGPVCAAYTACSNDLVSFGACYLVVDSFRYWNTRSNSFEIGTSDGENWINILTGIQNSVCMGQISGGTCDEVLACANQGKIVRGCTPKEGHHAGRYCVDSSTLAACTLTGVDDNTIESSIRCADIGMTCMEIDRIDRDGVIFATCAYPAEDSQEGISVTCDGSLARVQTQNAYFTYDCGQLNADCWPGSYRAWDNYDFCVTNRPVCTQQDMEAYCDGSIRVNWCNGREVGFDCRRMDLVCQQTQLLLWNMPLCIYPDNSCNPYSFQEECNNGIITYCGPNGVTTFDCKQYGYSGCSIQTLFAHCKARDGG